MGSAGKIVLAIGIILACVLMAVSGCAPKRSGTAAANQPPQVFITNTPPDSAQFSRNPELDWYGTDIDGYIAAFRYAVIIADSMFINGVKVSVDVFVERAKDSQFNWQYLAVSLDNPQSTATVRLYADVLHPVDSFITQYFFVQAEDNEGAWSTIKYRRYSRNNHYPNTHFRCNGVFINAQDSTSPLGGIQLTYSGADSTDWGRAVPPLEYEWRLYGPFLDTATIFVKIVDENCTYDPITGTYVNCNHTPVLDLNLIPSAISLPLDGNRTVSIPQPLRHSKGANYANDTTDVWVSDKAANIYDVYHGLNLTKTSKFKFIFWVRARDDGFVPDPTPAFQQFYVVEALFEKGVMVLDESMYTTIGGRWTPRSNNPALLENNSDTVVNVLSNFIKRAGYGDLDGADTAVEYYHFQNSGPVDLMKILSHKVLLLFMDDSKNKLNEDEGFGFTSQVFFGLNMGASGLLFARNLGGIDDYNTGNVDMPKSTNFALYFGISTVRCEGWLHYAMPVGNPPKPRGYYEEFVSAYPNASGFPEISVDTTLLNRRYVEWPYWYPYTADSTNDTTALHQIYKDSLHYFRAIPEIGAGTRTSFAAPLYLYVSNLGADSPFNGKVMGVRTQIGSLPSAIRSACFMFTPIGTDSVASLALFEKILPWLTEKFQTTGAAKVSVSSGALTRDITDRIEKTQHYLDYFTNYATPEEKVALGLTMKPFQINAAAPAEIIK